MTLEAHIERESCRIYKECGRALGLEVEVIKVGFDGWPDRLVLLGDGRHWWAEFKTLSGRLRAVQERRIKHLRENGDVVFTPRSISEAAGDFAAARRALGDP